MEKHDSIKLDYDVFEPAKGSNPDLTPIIFLHGFASNRETWIDVSPVIAEKTNRKTYAYDARNYGSSSYTEEFGLEILTDDLFHFMKIMNIPKAILVAHSLGAYVAFHAALQKPELIEMLIIEDTYMKPVTDQFCKEIYEYMTSLSESIRKIPKSLEGNEANKYVAQDIYDKLSEENKKWVPREMLYKVQIPMKRESDGQYIPGFNEKSIVKSVKEIQRWNILPTGIYEGPAIFLCGAKSPLAVMNFELQIKSYFPNAELITFEEGCHSLHSLLAEEFIDATVKILNK